jgi:hypothetical protein
MFLKLCFKFLSTKPFSFWTQLFIMSFFFVWSFVYIDDISVTCAAGGPNVNRNQDNRAQLRKNYLTF